MERLNSNIKKNSGNGNPKKAFYIQGNGTFLVHRRKFLIFQETEAPKKSLYFRKWNFFIFQETKLFYTSGNGTFLYFGKGIFKTLAYLEVEAFSESWRI